MRSYNLFLLLPNLADEQVKPLEVEIGEAVAKFGGQVKKIESFGKRKLSYTVKNVRHGYYLNYILELEPKEIIKLKSELKLKPEILRFELTQSTGADFKSGEELEKEEVMQKEKKEMAKAVKREKVDLAELDKKIDDILTGGEI